MRLPTRQFGIAATFALLVALLGPGAALAADYTISDAQSCTDFLTATGSTGQVIGDDCYIDDGTLPGGDTVTLGGGWTLRPQNPGTLNFLNNGTTNLGSGSNFYNAGATLNNGTINVLAGGNLETYASLSNAGVIDLASGTLLLNGSTGRLTNTLRDDGSCGEITGGGTVTNHGTLVSECFDAEVRRAGGKLKGRTVLNNDGSNQSVLWPNKKFKVGTVRWLYLYARNTSGVPDTLTMSASGPVADGFVVQYFRSSGTEITDEVAGEAGPFTTPLLQPGKRYGIRVRIEVTSFAPKGSSVLRALTVGSTGDPHATDVVTFGLTRNGNLVPPI